MKYLSLISLLGLSNATGRSLLKELRAKTLDAISSDKDKYSLEVFINGKQLTMADAEQAGDDAPEYLTGWEGTAPKIPMEASVKNDCRGVIKMLGESSNVNDGVKFNTNNPDNADSYIKKMTINMVTGKADETGFSVVLIAGGEEHYLGLDGMGKTFFIEGGNWSGQGQPLVLKDMSNRLLEDDLNYVSVVLTSNNKRVTSVKLNGVNAWGDISDKKMSGKIKAVVIRPQRNKVYIPAVRNDCDEFPER